MRMRASLWTACERWGEGTSPCICRLVGVYAPDRTGAPREPRIAPRGPVSFPNSDPFAEVG